MRMWRLAGVLGIRTEERSHGTRPAKMPRMYRAHELRMYLFRVFIGN